jgi:glutathione S-transferase
MSDEFRIIGAENSPYSVKVRSYFRFKALPHRWLRRAEAQEDYQRLAKLPLIPLVITPEGEGLQDSTPIIETIEKRFPEPSITPDDPIAAIVSAVLEEFGDEWGNKWMFHYRWARDVDQIAAARRLASDMSADPSTDAIEQAAVAIRVRMVPRVWFVGSNEVTAPQIEKSFVDTLVLLDRHLASRPYLFGGRPAFADFALWGQIFNAAKDPTPNALIAQHAPRIRPWLERMNEPSADGAFEPWDELSETLEPLLTDQVAELFLPWSTANAAAIAANDEEFTVSLAGHDWTQKPQKYHARSLAALKAKYHAVSRDDALNAVLDDTGCLRWLV